MIVNRSTRSAVRTDMTLDRTIDNVINRRTALVAGLAGAGTLTLAACGSSSGGSAAPKNHQT